MRRLLTTVLWIALLATPSGADRDQALRLAEEADKLLKARDWPGALAGFEKALAADEESLPALRGRAEALLGAARKADALAALHAGVRIGEARRTLPAGDVGSLMAMRTRLAELDPVSSEIESLLRKHAEGLAGQSVKWMTKDPAAAERALVRALRFVPDHAAAGDRLGRIQRARAGKRVTLWNGRDFIDWSWAEPPRWSVKDGAIHGDMLKHAMVVRSNKRFDGDMEVEIEARLVQRSDDLPVQFCMMPAYEGDDAYISYGFFVDHLSIGHGTSRKDGGEREIFGQRVAELDPPVKPEEWHTYTLQLEGPNLRAYLDGKLVGSVARPAGRDGGYLALRVQGCIAQIRKVVVTPK